MLRTKNDENWPCTMKFSRRSSKCEIVNGQRTTTDEDQLQYVTRVTQVPKIYIDYKGMIVFFKLLLF